MKKLALGLATASLMAAGAVQAQTVVGGGSFTDLTSATDDGTPFWDNASSDGATCNVGSILLGQVAAADCDNVESNSGAFGMLASGGQYYSNADAATPFMFSSAQNIRIRILNTVAGANSRVGYFTENEGTYSFTQLTPSSKTSTGSTYFIPGGMFGLYISASRLSDGCAGDTGCSDASGGMLQQHALFRGANGAYYVGMEDRDANTASLLNDRDYNDVILEVTATPEPMSMALLATGLLGMGGASVLRRRNKRDA